MKRKVMKPKRRTNFKFWGKAVVFFLTWIAIVALCVLEPGFGAESIRYAMLISLVTVYRFYSLLDGKRKVSWSDHPGGQPMKFGAIYPHQELGTDPVVIRD